MLKDEKVHMKDGLKMTKTVGCDYKQKNVTKSGKCIPKILNSHQDIVLPTAYDQQFDGEDYITFPLINDIKEYFNLADDLAWDNFKANNVVIRNGDNNMFIVFQSYDAFVHYFDNKIVKQNPRNHHLLNSKTKQQLAFDIDCKDVDYIRESEIDLSASTVEQSLRKIFQLPETVKCEVIDRSRAEKISYHVRFNVYGSANQITTILGTNGVDSDLFAYLDMNIYKT
jgi:hypothetical protein